MGEQGADGVRTIRVYDTLTNTKRALEPIEPGRIGMYVCGITVYDLTHIGHARVFLFFDVVQRFLRRLGYEVTYVRNHTDVDDKIIARAAERGEEPLALADHYIGELERDMGALGVAAADVEPRVSTHIEPIIEMVEQLIERGYAYEAGGDVYYRVERFEGYGKLSGRKLEDMEAGRSGRVGQEGSQKEHPFDFALWKSSKDGEPSWPSPWGAGRPGWHIECSAMSCTHLGESFDIHGGGSDLIFPHHENEIAQSEGATGVEPFARNWMHVGMVNVVREDEAGNPLFDENGKLVVDKMSKSLGNFWTTRDVLGGYHPEAIRYFMLTTSYRNPITYAKSNLDEATRRVEYLYTTLSKIDEVLARAGHDGAPPEAKWSAGQTGELIEGAAERLEAAMADDFNTPAALAVVGEVARGVNELTQSNKKPRPEVAWTLYRAHQELVSLGQTLGLLVREPAEALSELRDLKVGLLGLDVGEIEQKISAREQARQDRDWAQADTLRDELVAMGVELMDSPQGTTWRVA